MSSFCVCSSLLSDEAIDTLKRRYYVIRLLPDHLLNTPIQCHPDSIFAVIGNQVIFHRSYAEAHPETVEEIIRLGGFQLALSNASRGSVYPLDAGLNVAVGRDFLLCKPDTAAPELLHAAEQQKLRVIPVRQGYAGCACLVTDGGVLTFDPGISQVLARQQIPCTLLESGGITLPGYKDGFFGGACGFHERTLFINGNPESLACYPRLLEFVQLHGYRISPLCKSPVTDCGGIRFFR